MTTPTAPPVNASSEDPSIHAPPTLFETRLNRKLGRIANMLTSAVAVLLIGFVVFALIGVVVDGVGTLLEKRDFTGSAVNGVNAAFLAIILLELVHTTVTRGPMTRQLQEFLVIGVTVAVRSGLEVAAGAREHSAREVAINLVLNAAAVLVLVTALCLVRWRLHREHGDADR